MYTEMSKIRKHTKDSNVYEKRKVERSEAVAQPCIGEIQRAPSEGVAEWVAHPVRGHLGGSYL